jgi:hypothetical protein
MRIMQDLWTDLVGEALLTEAASSGGSRQRRLSEQAVLTALRAWLLQDYLLAYGTSLGSTRIFKRCYWIDGLGNTRFSPRPAVTLTTSATSPRSKQTSAPVPDLPLPLQSLAAAAGELAQLSRPIALAGFVLDHKSGKRRASIPQDEPSADGAPREQPVLPREGGLLSATWQELAPALLTTLEQSAAVFLLNPLGDGTALFRYSDLLPLYQRTAPTELFLWLSHKQMETRLLPGLHTAEGAAAMTNLLRSDRWKPLLARAEEADRPALAIDGLIELLATSLRPHFLHVQRLAFPVHTAPALVEKAPYTLLFATRRQDSLYNLNDVACELTRRLLITSQQGVLNEEWFRAQREEQATARRRLLAQQAYTLGQAGRIRRWPDLRHQLLLAHFAQATREEYDQVILELLQRGQVSCEWRRPASETPVPGHDDLLHWR